jgi:Tol biopolymer transport system component
MRQADPPPLETVAFAALGHGKIAFLRFLAGPEVGVYIVNADMHSWTRVPSRDYEAPALSPDGRRIAFWRESDLTSGYHIWVANVDGTGERQLTFPGTVVNTPSWTPDSKNVVYTIAANDGSNCPQAELYTQAPESETPTKVPLVALDCGANGDQAASISADGRVAFGCLASSLLPGIRASNICVSNGAAVATLYQPAQSDSFSNQAAAPAWSHNGQRVAFLVETVYQLPARGGRRITQSILVLSLSDGHIATLAAIDTANVGRPCWAADDEHIVFNVQRNSQSNVWVARSDGTGLTAVTTNPDAYDVYVSCTG